MNNAWAGQMTKEIHIDSPDTMWTMLSRFWESVLAQGPWFAAFVVAVVAILLWQVIKLRSGRKKP